MVVGAPGFSGAGGGVTPAGVACGVASALSWALGTVGFKRYEARVSTLWAVALPFLLGGAALMAVGLASEKLSDVSWTAPLVGSILYSALVGTCLAWLLYFGLVRAGEASRVASLVFAVPLAAVAIGAVFFGENLGLSLLVGSTLVVSGVYLANRTPRGEVPASRSGGPVS